MWFCDKQFFLLYISPALCVAFVFESPRTNKNGLRQGNAKQTVHISVVSKVPQFSVFGVQTKTTLIFLLYISGTLR